MTKITTRRMAMGSKYDALLHFNLLVDIDMFLD